MLVLSYRYYCENNHGMLSSILCSILNLNMAFSETSYDLKCKYEDCYIFLTSNFHYFCQTHYDCKKFAFLVK